MTRNGQSVTWTSYNFPSHVPNGTKYHDFYYDANRQRYKQVYYNGSASETTIFVGGILEKRTAGGITEYRGKKQDTHNNRQLGKEMAMADGVFGG